MNAGNTENIRSYIQVAYSARSRKNIGFFEGIIFGLKLEIIVVLIKGNCRGNI